MTTYIENYVNECENNLDFELIKRFRNMNPIEFVQYLTNEGNHKSEIEYYLRKIVDQNYANQVLETIKEKYRHDIITSGKLSFWKFA